jgi:hypothetical protein
MSNNPQPGGEAKQRALGHFNERPRRGVPPEAPGPYGQLPLRGSRSPRSVIPWCLHPKVRPWRPHGRIPVSCCLRAGPKSPALEKHPGVTILPPEVGFTDNVSFPKEESLVAPSRCKRDPGAERNARHVCTFSA